MRENMGITHKTTLLRTDGFVRNIHSRNAFDVIRADVVLNRMEKLAGKSCGAYYEIYEVRLLGMALDYLAELPLKDRPVFMVKWFTEFGHLNRGDMLTSEQHRCHNEKKKFQRRV